MLFAVWEVRIVKKCDRALENARSQFFTIRTDPKLVNNIFFFFPKLSNEKKKTHGKKLTQALL